MASPCFRVCTYTYSNSDALNTHSSATWRRLRPSQSWRESDNFDSGNQNPIQMFESPWSKINRLRIKNRNGQHPVAFIVKKMRSLRVNGKCGIWIFVQSWMSFGWNHYDDDYFKKLRHIYLHVPQIRTKYRKKSYTIRGYRTFNNYGVSECRARIVYQQC